MRVETLKVNQTIVHHGDYSTFFSYDTPIATKIHGTVILYPKWQHSSTTSKYRAIFLGEPTKDTREKLANGVYKMEEQCLS